MKASGKSPMEYRAYRPPNMNRGSIGALFSGVVVAAFMFLALPLTQMLSEVTVEKDVRPVSDVYVPPPIIDVPEILDEPVEEMEEVVDELEFEREPQPIELSQLEVSLSPNLGNALQVDFGFHRFGFTPDVVGEMGIFEIKDLDTGPVLDRASANRNRPRYPRELERSGISGEVQLIIVIDERGNVISVEVESATNRLFSKSAMSAVKKWKFKPGTINGKPVKCRRRQPIGFKF